MSIGPDGPDAGHRDRLQRDDQLGRDVVEVVEDRLRLGRQVHLAEADARQPALQRGHDRVDVAADLRAGKR